MNKISPILVQCKATRVIYRNIQIYIKTTINNVIYTLCNTQGKLTVPYYSLIRIQVKTYTISGKSLYTLCLVANGVVLHWEIIEPCKSSIKYAWYITQFSKIENNFFWQNCLVQCGTKVIWFIVHLEEDLEQ